jgi:RimJ/RimL family protein N-acetyltransferase
MNEFELEPVGNWPGYDYPLACRVIRESDQKVLYPVMKRSAEKLKGFIAWGKYVPSWDFKTVSQFVKDHVNDPPPRFHLIFSIGKEVVGFGSLAPMDHEKDVQVALWVAKGHERRGIGSWIVSVLEFYAFEVFGYHHLFYQHDAMNRASGKLPAKHGFTFSHSFDTPKTAMNESGLWMSWVKPRPAELPPGFIDTGDWGKWTEMRFPWVSLV